MATPEQNTNGVLHSIAAPEYHNNLNGGAHDAKAPLVDSKAPLDTKTPNGDASMPVPHPAPITNGKGNVIDPDAPLATSPVSDLTRHATGTFAAGAAVSQSPNAGTGTLHDRAETADSQLSPEAKSKILKNETKNSKQMTKILKGEAKSQASLLKSAIKELSRLQSVQKQAAKDESRALASHTKAVKIEQKSSIAFNKAKAAYERAQADLKSSTEALETTREHARTQTEALKVKSLEVEQATRQKAVDDREREVKIAELKGGK